LRRKDHKFRFGCLDTRFPFTLNAPFLLYFGEARLAFPLSRLVHTGKGILLIHNIPNGSNLPFAFI
jgi:hypothetical protein